LRRLELQLCGPPARFVLGDPRGLFDELSSVGGTRAEDQPDLSLLDDGVGLGSEARIHEQLVHVAKPADLTVDEIFALARSIEPPRDLDVARERVDDLGKPHMSVAVPMTVPVTVAVAMAIAMALFLRRLGRRLEFAQLGDRNVGPGVRQRLGRQRQTGQPQAHFGGRAGLAGVASAEDDVLHLFAAQALCALLAKYPGDGIRDVALAAAVGPDDGGYALVERQLRAIGKGLETGNLEAFEAHSLVT
jgi:hypothetical protein